MVRKEFSTDSLQGLFEKILPGYNNNETKKINKSVKIRTEERPEYRTNKKNELQYVVFRTRDKYRRQTRYIGKKNKEFPFYKKAHELGIYNSMENRKKNARRN